jgi:hypothetical protein
MFTADNFLEKRRLPSQDLLKPRASRSSLPTSGAKSPHIATLRAKWASTYTQIVAKYTHFAPFQVAGPPISLRRRNVLLSAAPQRRIVAPRIQTVAMTTNIAPLSSLIATFSPQIATALHLFATISRYIATTCPHPAKRKASSRRSFKASRKIQDSDSAETCHRDGILLGEAATG